MYAFRNRPGTGRVSAARRLARLSVNSLEGRIAPAAFIVTNTLDSGVGSLRQTVLDANAAVGPDSIHFDPVVFASPQTITLDPNLNGIKVTGPLSIIGPGPDMLTLSGSGKDYALNLATSQVDVSGLTFAKAPGTAVNIESGQASFQKCAFTSNGNGIYVRSKSKATIDECSVTDSFTGLTTVGLSASVRRSTFERNQQGIFCNGSAVIVDESLLANNLNSSVGGAIQMSSGSLVVRNSTLANNRAGRGGAIYVTQGSLQITSSTLTANSAAREGGAIYFGNGTQQNPIPTIGLTNSIVAGNLSFRGTDVFCFPGSISADHSIIGVTNDGNFTVTGAGNITGTRANPKDPRLFPLAANGGPTRSLAPKFGSPAIDSGTNSASLANDQRGFPRVVGSSADIGAVEVGFEPLASASVADIATTNAAPVTITVTYSDLLGGGIDLATLGTGDITVNGPGAFSIAPTFANSIVNGPTVTATYVFTPAAAWSATDNGTYAVSIAANSVLDSDMPSPRSVFAGQVGQFNVIIGQHYIVDTIVDAVDGNYGPGNLSLREAVHLANGGLSQTQDLITFDPIVFGVPQTISLDSALDHVFITDAIDIQGPGPGLLTILGTEIHSGFVAQRIIKGSDLRFSGLTIAGTCEIANHYSTLVVKNCVFSGVGVPGWSPAISTAYASASLTLEDCTISGYQRSQSAVTCEGSLIMRRCSVTGNSASGWGGGMVTSGPSTTIEDSTISGNTAGYSGNGNVQGGGLFSGVSYLSANNPGILVIRNCTIAFNRVIGHSSTGKGGGIFTYCGQVTIENSTIAFNTANYGGGFAADLSAVEMTLNSTIIARNSAGSTSRGLDAYAQALIVVGNNNLIGISGFPITGTNNLIGGVSTGLINPRLGPLADNGGPTKTLALLPGSPGIDAGSNPTNLTTDQRGFARVVGARADIGAYESRGFTLTTSGTPQSAMVTTTFASPLQVTLRETGGSALPGATISFLAPASGASATLSPTSALTDAQGRVSVIATANDMIGKYNVIASTGPLSVTFALTNTGTPNVSVQLLHGNLIVSGNNMPNTITVSGQTGSVTVKSNLVNLGTFAVTGSITINGGSAADSITLAVNSGQSLPAFVTITAGGGDDLVQIRSSDGPAVPGVISNLIVNLGEGANMLNDQGVSISGLWSIIGGSGADMLGTLISPVGTTLSANLGNGKNTAEVKCNVGGTLHYVGGTGLDALTITGAHTYSLIVNLGAGDDTFTYSAAASVGSAIIDFGAGNDTYISNGTIPTWYQLLLNL